MSIVVICVDGLPTHLLGGYGNTLFETPAIDSCVARGFTLERCLLSGDRAGRDVVRNRWLETFASAGWQVTRFCHPAVATEDREPITQVVFDFPVASVPAQDWLEAGPAIFLSQVLGYLDSVNDQRHCVWVDFPLLQVAWDAPVAWRAYLAGEGDPDVLQTTEVPAIVGEGKDLQATDPDMRLVWEQACSAQVMLLDHCVEVLTDWLKENWVDASLLLTAAAGFSLGEHGNIGWFSESVYAEQCHVPFVFSPPGQPNAIRVPGVQSREDWLGEVGNVIRAVSEPSQISTDLQSRSQTRWCWSDYSLFSATAESQRQAVMTWSDTEVAIRTPAWSFRWEEDRQVQLFAMPDDRFEQNDVADRCQTLAHQFLKNVVAFGGCLFPPEFEDTWWAQADETHATIEQWGSDDGESGSEMGLRQLSEVFWIAAT